MSTPAPKKLYPLLLLTTIFIVQASVCNDDVCSISNSPYLKIFNYLKQFSAPDIQDNSCIDDTSFIDKSDDIPASSACILFDNKKDFIFSDSCRYPNGILFRHLVFPDNIAQYIQKMNSLHQSSDDPLSQA